MCPFHLPPEQAQHQQPGSTSAVIALLWHSCTQTYGTTHSPTPHGPRTTADGRGGGELSRG